VIYEELSRGWAGFFRVSLGESTWRYLCGSHANRAGELDDVEGGEARVVLIVFAEQRSLFTAVFSLVELQSLQPHLFPPLLHPLKSREKH